MSPAADLAHYRRAGIVCRSTQLTKMVCPCPTCRAYQVVLRAMPDLGANPHRTRKAKSAKGVA